MPTGARRLKWPRVCPLKTSMCLQPLVQWAIVWTESERKLPVSGIYLWKMYRTDFWKTSSSKSFSFRVQYGCCKSFTSHVFFVRPSVPSGPHSGDLVSAWICPHIWKQTKKKKKLWIGFPEYLKRWLRILILIYFCFSPSSPGGGGMWWSRARTERGRLDVRLSPQCLHVLMVFKPSCCSCSRRTEVNLVVFLISPKQRCPGVEFKLSQRFLHRRFAT